MDEVIREITSLAERFPSIRRLVLFGSRARGDFSKRSDYDIAVFGCDEKDRVDFTDAVEELPFLEKIDLVFVRTMLMKMPIYESIRREGIPIMDRFQAKLSNYARAVARLREAIEKSREDPDLTVRDGVIQRFEFTTELAWKTLKAYLAEQGEVDINSPKPALRTAYRAKLVDDSAGWAQILDDRNLTSHVYEDEMAAEIYGRIVGSHIDLFEKLLERLKNAETEE